MQSRARSRKDIIKAALTVVLGLILLGVFIVALGGRRFWENYDYYAIVFDSVKDLSAGRPVKYAGLDIGRVEDISIDPKSPGQVLVRIAVKQGFPLFNGTFALISQKGLVGDNYVFLQLQGQAGQQLKPGSHIPSKQVMSLNELANQISDLVNELRPKLLSVADGLNDLQAEDNREKVRQAHQERGPEHRDDAASHSQPGDRGGRQPEHPHRATPGRPGLHPGAGGRGAQQRLGDDQGAQAPQPQPPGAAVAGSVSA